MTGAKFNAFCRALPATTHVVQWGGADVWKVGGKVFALGRVEGGVLWITFKVGAIAYEVLKDQPGLRPAPYLASRGLTWIQHFEKPGLPDAALRDHLREAHRLIAAKLPKRTRAALGLDGAA
jgi:predicted DNA-binding protein (MmcQ/YjbR family)